MGSFQSLDEEKLDHAMRKRFGQPIGLVCQEKNFHPVSLEAESLVGFSFP